MANARVEVEKEVTKLIGNAGWELCFQWCEYIFDNGNSEKGYRFIWKKPDGCLQAARGQARIPSVGVAMELISKAILEGWGNEKDKEEEDLAETYILIQIAKIIGEKDDVDFEYIKKCLIEKLNIKVSDEKIRKIIGIHNKATKKYN